MCNTSTSLTAHVKRAGGASAADLSSAAAQRAQQRQHLSDSIQQAESQSVLDDAAHAEEDDPETAFNEEGIPFEPFHLHREREVSVSVIQGTVP